MNAKSLASGLILCGLVFLLAACGETEREALSDNEMAEMEAAAAAFQLQVAEVKRQVEKILPSSSYVDNSLIPELEDLALPPKFDSVARIRVGAPWIFNDEVAPWFIAQDLGFFAEAGLEVELIEGGPGRNPLTMLLANKLDLAVSADPRLVPAVLASPTGGDVVIVSTVLQRSPVGIMTLDHRIPKNERSDLKFTMRDLRHKVFGVQGGSERLAEMFLRASGVPPEDVKIQRISNGPELLMAGKVDYMISWIVNQPRILEANGYNNWAFFLLSEAFYQTPADITVVRREYLEKNQHIVERYNWAMLKAVRFLLDEPQKSAELTLPRIVESGLNLEQILRRFELQRELIEVKKGSKLMHVDPDQMNELVAYDVQAGVIELPDEAPR